MGGRASRRKGHDFERSIVSLLKPYFPLAKRGLDQTQAGAQPDVDGTPFWVECKKGKRTQPKAAYLQAVEKKQKVGDTRPILAVTRDDNQAILVTMDWAQFERFLAEVQSA